MFKKLAQSYFVALAFLTALAARADVDYTTLTSAISFTNTIAAVLAVAAGLIGVYLAIKGVKVIIAMLRG